MIRSFNNIALITIIKYQVMNTFYIIDKCDCMPEISSSTLMFLGAYIDELITVV